MEYVDEKTIGACAADRRLVMLNDTIGVKRKRLEELESAQSSIHYLFSCRSVSLRTILASLHPQTCLPKQLGVPIHYKSHNLASELLARFRCFAELVSILHSCFLAYRKALSRTRRTNSAHELSTN